MSRVRWGVRLKLRAEMQFNHNCLALVLLVQYESEYECGL